mgnify:CR=1 FL=1
MKSRTLGQGKLQVSALGFGCMGLNFSYGHSLTKAESIALVRQAVERGVIHFQAGIVGAHQRLGLQFGPP